MQTGRRWTPVAAENLLNIKYTKSLVTCELDSRMEPAKAVIIGAGPAGLTAAYLLSKAGLPVIVLEADPHYVGGISRTVQYKGFHFDIGGHRFFSKSKEVEDFWTEILHKDLLDRPRSSRIYYNG